MKMTSQESCFYGESHVAAELVRLGYVVGPTIAGTKDIDILAVKKDTNKHVSIQVKTSQNKNLGWEVKNISEENVKDDLFYVLVLVGETPEYYILPSAKVLEVSTKEHEDYLSKTKRDGTPRKDVPMKKVTFDYIDRETYLNNWTILER